MGYSQRENLAVALSFLPGGPEQPLVQTDRILANTGFTILARFLHSL